MLVDPGGEWCLSGGPGEVLAYLWPDAAGNRISGDVSAPKPQECYDLLPPALTHGVVQIGNDWQVNVEAKALALLVSSEADQPARFSINAFTVFPGNPATVTFTPATPGAAPDFTLRDLHSATYGPA